MAIGALSEDRDCDQSARQAQQRAAGSPQPFRRNRSPRRQSERHDGPGGPAWRVELQPHCEPEGDQGRGRGPQAEQNPRRAKAAKGMRKGKGWTCRHEATVSRASRIANHT